MATWTNLTSTSQVDEIVNTISSDKTCVILKHSTSCSISSIAKLRLDNNLDSLGAKSNLYYLDLLQYRDVSKYIADQLDVYHESPQVIIIKNGEATYDVSHLDISIDDLISEV